MDSSRGHCYSRGYRHLRLRWAVFSGAPCNLWVGHKLVDKLLAAHLSDDVLRSEEQGGWRVLRAVSLLLMSFFLLAPISLISFRLVDSSSLSMLSFFPSPCLSPVSTPFSGHPQQFFSVSSHPSPFKSSSVTHLHSPNSPFPTGYISQGINLGEQVRTTDLGLTESGMLTGLFWKLTTSIGK